MTDEDFKYDVAFSFLSGDLGLAHALDNLLPNLRTFVFDRKKEDVKGDDGMDGFGRVFGHETRLAVILFRKGWGDTEWTAVEQEHIHGRAKKSRMRSFKFVRLDD